MELNFKSETYYGVIREEMWKPSANIKHVLSCWAEQVQPQAYGSYYSEKAIKKWPEVLCGRKLRKTNISWLQIHASDTELTLFDWALWVSLIQM